MGVLKLEGRIVIQEQNMNGSYIPKEFDSSERGSCDILKLSRLSKKYLAQNPFPLDAFLNYVFGIPVLRLVYG